MWFKSLGFAVFVWQSLALIWKCVIRLYGATELKFWHSNDLLIEIENKIAVARQEAKTGESKLGHVSIILWFLCFTSFDSHQTYLSFPLTWLSTLTSTSCLSLLSPSSPPHLACCQAQPLSRSQLEMLAPVVYELCSCITLNKDPAVWPDGDRPANTCIAPSFGWMVFMEPCYPW